MKNLNSASKSSVILIATVIFSLVFSCNNNSLTSSRNNNSLISAIDKNFLEILMTQDGDRSVLSNLIDDIDIQTTGSTALRFLVNETKIDWNTVRLLFEHGVDPQIEINKLLKNRYEIVYHSVFPIAALVFDEYSLRDQTTLFYNAARLSNLDFLSTAITKGFNPNNTLWEGKTAFQIACEKQDHALMNHLIKNGALPGPYVADYFKLPTKIYDNKIGNDLVVSNSQIFIALKKGIASVVVKNNEFSSENEYLTNIEFIHLHIYKNQLYAITCSGEIYSFEILETGELEQKSNNLPRLFSTYSNKKPIDAIICLSEKQELGAVISSIGSDFYTRFINLDNQNYEQIDYPEYINLKLTAAHLDKKLFLAFADYDTDIYDFIKPRIKPHFKSIIESEKIQNTNTASLITIPAEHNIPKTDGYISTINVIDDHIMIQNSLLINSKNHTTSLEQLNFISKWDGQKWNREIQYQDKFFLNNCSSMILQTQNNTCIASGKYFNIFNHQENNTNRYYFWFDHFVYEFEFYKDNNLVLLTSNSLALITNINGNGQNAPTDKFVPPVTIVGFDKILKPLYMEHYDEADEAELKKYIEDQNIATHYSHINLDRTTLGHEFSYKYGIETFEAFQTSDNNIYVKAIMPENKSLLTPDFSVYCKLDINSLSNEALSQPAKIYSLGSGFYEIITKNEYDTHKKESINSDSNLSKLAKKNKHNSITLLRLVYNNFNIDFNWDPIFKDFNYDTLWISPDKQYGLLVNSFTWGANGELEYSDLYFCYFGDKINNFITQFNLNKELSDDVNFYSELTQIPNTDIWPEAEKPSGSSYFLYLNEDQSEVSSVADEKISKESESILYEVTLSDIITTSLLTEPLDSNAYHPVKILDNNPKTCWLEGAVGPGIGESLEISFDHEIIIDAIKIMPGVFWHEYWVQNNRIKTLTIDTGNEKFKVDFFDKEETQVANFNSPLKTKNIVFTINDIYKTTNWDDTGISEIHFLYKNKEYQIDLGVFKDFLKKTEK